MESVAGLPWTEWPNVRGISGRITVEYAAVGVRDFVAFIHQLLKLSDMLLLTADQAKKPENAPLL